MCPSESQGAPQRKYRNLFWIAVELDTVSQPIQSSTDDCVSFEKGMIGSPTEKIASRPRAQPNFENAKLIPFYLRNKNKKKEVFLKISRFSTNFSPIEFQFKIFLFQEIISRVNFCRWISLFIICKTVKE